MDSLFTNKVAASVLVTGLLLMGLNEASHSFFHVEEHERPGMFVDVPEVAAAGPAEEEGPVDYLALMTAADPSAGAEVAVKCQQCHTFEQGGEALQGPNLYGVLGRDVASVPGFSYSSGENGLEGVEGVWDYEKLDHFLARPRGFASNTAMNFVGLRRESERADIMAYLRTLTNGTPYPMPEPLPEVEEASETVEGEAAEGEVAEGEAVEGETPAEGEAPAATEGEGETAPAEEAPAEPAPAEH